MVENARRLVQLDHKIGNCISIVSELEHGRCICGGFNIQKIKTLKQDLNEGKQSVEEIKEEIQHACEDQQQHATNGYSSQPSDSDLATAQLSGDREYDQKTIARLEKEIFYLDEKVERLEERVKKLEEHRKTINTQEIACNFEKDLVAYVYPTGRRVGSERVFENMISWLEWDVLTPERIEARGRWEDLKTAVSWTPKLENVLIKMKVYSTGHVYPLADDLKGVKGQISNVFDEEEKECICAIIRAMRKVNRLMAMEE